MKKLVLIMACLCALTLDAKTAGEVKNGLVTKAITDEGRVVFLNSDGTWRYDDAGPAETKPLEIKLNKSEFKKAASATFLLKSTKNNSAFWINPTTWNFQRVAETTSQHEYKFLLKGGDLYGMVITEQIEIDLENLGNIALTNARNIAPDMQIVAQEYRMVNGLKVLYQKMAGTAKGLRFAFEGYYYSDKSGTTQLVTWSGENLIEKYQKEINDFLNGLTIQEKEKN